MKAGGRDVIRAEKLSETTTKGRDELKTILGFLRDGDVLMVTRIDRLAASAICGTSCVLYGIRGAVLKATERPIDISTAAGQCFLVMLGVFAQFETNLRRERQLEGIANAKAAGVYKGRRPSIDQAEVEKLKAGGLVATEIAKRPNIRRASVYRVLSLPAPDCSFGHVVVATFAQNAGKR